MSGAEGQGQAEMDKWTIGFSRRQPRAKRVRAENLFLGSDYTPE
jgi:hypothetical protein